MQRDGCRKCGHIDGQRLPGQSVKNERCVCVDKATKDTVEREREEGQTATRPASTERPMERAMEFEAQPWESAASAGREDSWNVSDEGDCTKRKESRRRLAETDVRETAACRKSHDQGEKKLPKVDGVSILPSFFQWSSTTSTRLGTTLRRHCDDRWCRLWNEQQANVTSATHMAAPPPTRGKVRFRTTAGEWDVELWCEQAKQTCRRFLARCARGRFQQAQVERVVRRRFVQLVPQCDAGACQPSSPHEETNTTTRRRRRCRDEEAKTDR